MANRVCLIIYLFVLFELVVKTHLTVHDNNHGFVSTDDKTYFSRDFAPINEDLSSVIRGSKINAINNLNLKVFLKFEPEFLDFKRRPLGVPHLERVTLYNVDGNKTIDMTSISGSTVHFHSSFFEDKRIPPLGNTTFNVVFLGREEGPIESNLFIHTTEGHIQYQVKGASVSSPYRLRPIVGIKLPLNTTFSPLIYMHNPYTDPIQVVEIYSSGGDFHLELPSGELEGPKDMWEIPPLQTKAVIRVRFYARTEQNHTAYVRIKLNNTEDVLVVPLEVEVISSSGLCTHQGFVDFGVGGSLDLPSQVKLSVYNPSKKAIRIHSVSTTSKAIKVDFENVRIQSDQKGSMPATTEIASLTLDWKTAFSNKDFSGKIIVKYKNGKTKTEIPYFLTVLEGGLLYNSSATRYFINETQEILSRNILIKNSFESPLVLTDVVLGPEAKSYFYVSNFTPVVLQQNEQRVIFSLNFKQNVPLSNLKIDSQILVKTNISDVHIPLLSYNGKLQIYLPFKSKDNALYLGLVSLDSKKETHLLVLNNNPVNVHLKKLETSLPLSSIEIVGCDNRGNYSEALVQDVHYNMTKCSNLKTAEYAVLKLTIQAPSSEGQVWGDISVETQYEQLSIPVHYKVAQGKLEIGPDRLVFDQCFPGKICSHPLRVHSTFNDPMVIEDILSIPPDLRLASKHSGHIMARSTKVIGYLYLNPSLGCQNECYSGLPDDAAAQWLQTFSLAKSTAEFDLNLVNVFYNRYLNQTTNGFMKWQNLTMRLDTSEVKGHMFKTRVKMSWPTLISEEQIVNKTTFTFPLTQVGNVTYQNITIRNPSSHNLMVQLVMDSVYPENGLLLEGLPPNFIFEKFKNSQHSFFFAEKTTDFIETFKKLVNVNVHKDSLPVLLRPNENFTFTIGFKAEDTLLNSAFIYLRNNLTVLEIINLNGLGAFPNFKFGNRRPGSSQPLIFELTEKHLRDCERDQSKKYPPPNLTVKRSFTARNTGDVTIFISNFLINGLECEGYGFKILNCEPFALLPNGTKKIDIAFTSDFTLARITRTLILETSLNYPINYTLVTTVPSYYLSLCSNILTRPTWEPYLYYVMVCSMLVLLCFIIIAPVMESDKIIKEVLGSMNRNGPSVQPTLDLRLVGMQTRSEIKLQTPEAELVTVEPKCKNLKLPDCKSGRKSEVNDTKTVKHECDKSTLIPTVGRSKKKLCKKTSEEETPDLTKKINQDQKLNKIKLEVKVNNAWDAPKKSNVSNWKEIRKPCKVKKQAEAVSFEEETSSTTTESSNNEDIKKDIDKRAPKKIFTVKLETLDATESLSKPEKKKSHKASIKCKESTKDANAKVEIKSCTESKTKNLIKDKKEKQTFNKKLSGSKTQLKASNESLRNISPVAHASICTQPATVWGENRATFSDVVARNDQTFIHNSIRSLSHTNNVSKPTMYVEPYKQTSTDLGPIGSRKLEFWPNYQAESLQGSEELQFNQLSNSLFSEGHNLASEGSNPLVDVEQPNDSLLYSNVDAELQQQHLPLEDPWNCNNTSLNDCWDLPQNSVDETTRPQLTNQQSGYLWGSSSVWQPWTPFDHSRRITRTPPGFNTVREIEERLQNQQNYDPFGVSNIWARQQQNPWNYPQE